MCVYQHQGSRWALPLARLSALCQALFISARASLQRFCKDESNTSLWGRSTCVQWGHTWAFNQMDDQQIYNLGCWYFGTNIAVFIFCHKPVITVYLPTWKMTFHVLSNAPSSRSLSSQPLKYKIQGGRNWVRSVANSYRGRKWEKVKIERLHWKNFTRLIGIYGVLMYCLRF